MLCVIALCCHWTNQRNRIKCTKPNVLVQPTQILYQITFSYPVDRQKYELISISVRQRGMKSEVTSLSLLPQACPCLASALATPAISATSTVGWHTLIFLAFLYSLDHENNYFFQGHKTATNQPFFTILINILSK